ncbi:MliC family protein [Bartonella choladocola]|uniref:Membrane-bound lysozyme-inhibitor of c-type lysozyme n=1 Tax=Bartonella choladocola TaxID=2750995 RepID=A0A1U9MET1_9HYPH|nr:MliC family protein [Bartonella choladocola]AQT46219.1 hypothetical protein BBC0122_000780 [Bartonella choladocola]
MLKKTFLMTFILAALYGFAANAQASSVRNQTYICERGVALQAIFIKDKDDSYAVIFVDGKLVAMHEDVKGPERLFIAVDDQDNYRFHIKGNDASLTYKDSDQSKAEKVVLQSCQADIAED